MVGRYLYNQVLAKWTRAQTHPFDPAVEGVIFPNRGVHASVPFMCRGTFYCRRTSGSSCIMILPNPIVALNWNPTDNQVGAVAGWTQVNTGTTAQTMSLESLQNMAARYPTFRVVAGGVRITSCQAPGSNYAQAFMRTCSLPVGDTVPGYASFTNLSANPANVSYNALVVACVGAGANLNPDLYPNRAKGTNAQLSQYSLDLPFQMTSPSAAEFMDVGNYNMLNFANTAQTEGDDFTVIGGAVQTTSTRDSTRCRGKTALMLNIDLTSADWLFSVDVLYHCEGVPVALIGTGDACIAPAVQQAPSGWFNFERALASISKVPWGHLSRVVDGMFPRPGFRPSLLEMVASNRQVVA